MGSAGLLTFALIFAWTSIAVAEQYMAAIHVKFVETATGYRIDVNFNASMIQKFHSCLCDGSATNCVAHYKLVDYTVTGVTDDGRVVSGQISHAYNCTNNGSSQSVICTQLSPQTLPDFSSGNVLSQSFLLTQSPCNLKCIVFIWQFPGESMAYDDSVGVANCGTNCACTRSTTATVASPAATSQISPISIEPKTTGTASKTTITTSSTALTTVKTSGSTSSSSPQPPPPPTTTTTNKARTTATTIATTTTTTPATAANLGSKTSDEDTPVGVIVGAIIGVIIIIAASVIGVTIWRRRRAAPGLSEKMDHQMDTSKESSEARTQGLNSKNNRNDTSDTQLPSTDNSYLDDETYAVPHKTKHQQDAIATGIAQNGTNSALLSLNQQYVDERNVPGNSASTHRSDFLKSDISTFTKEDVSRKKNEQPKRNIVEDDFGYAFAEEPPDQEKSQNLNFNTALFYQPTGFDKGGSFCDDYGYGGVYDVDVAGDGDGGTRNNDDNKGKTIPSNTSVSNVKNSDRNSGTGDYGYSYIDQEFSKDSKATPVTGHVNASASRNSDNEYPVTENDYDFVSVNGNTHTNNNPCIMDTNIDDDYSTIGNECHSRKPVSDTGSNSKNVYAKLHEEKRDMHNPYNSLLSPKEDPEVRKPMALPSQKNLPTNQSARYSIAQTSPNPFSNHGSDATISVTDLAPSTNSLPMTNTHGANGDQNNGVYRIKPFDGDDEYAVVCKKKS